MRQQLLDPFNFLCHLKSPVRARLELCRTRLSFDKAVRTLERFHSGCIWVGAPGFSRVKRPHKFTGALALALTRPVCKLGYANSDTALVRAAYLL